MGCELRKQKHLCMTITLSLICGGDDLGGVIPSPLLFGVLVFNAVAIGASTSIEFVAIEVVAEAMV